MDIGVKCFFGLGRMRPVAAKHCYTRAKCRLEQNPFGIIRTCKGNLALRLFTN